MEIGFSLEIGKIFDEEISLEEFDGNISLEVWTSFSDIGILMKIFVLL